MPGNRQRPPRHQATAHHPLLFPPSSHNRLKRERTTIENLPIQLHYATTTTEHPSRTHTHRSLHSAYSPPAAPISHKIEAQLSPPSSSIPSPSHRCPPSSFPPLRPDPITHTHHTSSSSPPTAPISHKIEAQFRRPPPPLAQPPLPAILLPSPSPRSHHPDLITHTHHTSSSFLPTAPISHKIDPLWFRSASIYFDFNHFQWISQVRSRISQVIWRYPWLWEGRRK